MVVVSVLQSVILDQHLALFLFSLGQKMY